MDLLTSSTLVTTIIIIVLYDFKIIIRTVGHGIASQKINVFNSTK